MIYLDARRSSAEGGTRAKADVPSSPTSIRLPSYSSDRLCGFAMVRATVYGENAGQDDQELINSDNIPDRLPGYGYNGDGSPRYPSSAISCFSLMLYFVR